MLLEVRDLHVGYGDAPALWGVSLGVASGEIVSVIGPNGAGKTTLINTIAGLLRSRQGELRFDGTDMTRVRAHQFCGHGIALVPEGRRLFPKMSVEENLELGCYLPAARASRTRSLERVYGLFPILRDKRGQLSGELSGGQQQMLAIGRALMGAPRLLLLDEPSSGLDVGDTTRLAGVLDDVRRRSGAAVVLIEHDLAVVEAVADRLVVLDLGRVLADGPVATVLADPAVRRAYLGTSA